MSAGSIPPQQPTARSGPLGRGLIGAVKWYRDAVSPALPPRCRFYPSCSSYALTALQRYGPARGSWLALRRIVRCGPWHPGGVDHVPSGYDAGAPTDGAPTDQMPTGHAVPAASARKEVGPQRRSVSQETAVV